MKNRSVLRRGLMVAVMLAIGAGLSSGLDARAASAEAGSVKVTIKYTGKGDVDANHRVWVWLFDTPNIGPGAMPISETSVDTNGGTATFDAVGAPEVWIAVAYDLNGHFAGMAPPPSGSPASVYGMAAGAPTPVTPGEKGAVTLAFDDTFKMP